MTPNDLLDTLNSLSNVVEAAPFMVDVPLIKYALVSHALVSHALVSHALVSLAHVSLALL